MAEQLTVTGLKLETGGTERGVSDLTRLLDRLDRATEKVEKEFDDLQRSSRRTDRELRQAGRGAGSARGNFANLSRTIKSAAGAIAGFVIVRQMVRGLSRASRAVFDTNRELQDLEATLRTVTGGIIQGERAFDLIIDFAKTTPFEIQNLTQSFIDLRARGVAPNEERLKGLGNLAAAFTQDITTLTDAIVSGSAGMSRPLRRFGVDMKISGDTAVVSFQGVRREIDLSADSLSEFLAEMGNSPRLANAMKNRMDTLGGSVSNLADTSAIFAKDIGEQGLNAELVRTIQNMDKMVGEGDDLARSLGEGAAGGVRLFNEALRVGGPILQFWADQLAKFGDQSLRLAAPRIEAFGGLEDVRRVDNLLKRAAEERNEAEAAIQELEAGLAETPPSPSQGLPATLQAVFEGVRRVPVVGGLVETDASRTRSSLEEQLERERERLRKGEAEIAAGVRRRRELLTPGLETFETGLTEGGGTPKIDAITKSLERLDEQLRGIEATQAALEGTSLEDTFDAEAEAAQALEGAFASLISAGLDPLDPRIQEIVESWESYTIAIEAAEEETRKQEEAAKRLEEQLDRMRESVTGTRAQVLGEDEATKAERAAARIENTAMNMALAVDDAAISIITRTDSIGDAFVRMAQTISEELLRLTTSQLIVEPLFGFFKGILGGGAPTGPSAAIPGLASGGPLGAFEPAIVGEEGPELFVPSTAGNVIPNNRLGSSGPSTNVTIVYSPTFQGTVDDQTAELIVEKGGARVLEMVDDWFRQSPRR